MPTDTKPHKARQAKKRHARLRKSGTIADVQRELWRAILCAKEKDAFSGDVFFFGDVAFDRDETGAVMTMRVSKGRVCNLVFEKQKP